MIKFYTDLKIALWSVVVLFLGASAYTCIDYFANPEAYNYTSGPWYLGIEIYVGLAAFFVAVILILMLFVKRKRNKKGKHHG